MLREEEPASTNRKFSLCLRVKRRPPPILPNVDILVIMIMMLVQCSDDKDYLKDSNVNDQRAEASSQHFWSTIRHGGPSSKGASPSPRTKTQKTQQIWQNIHNAKEQAFMKAAQVRFDENCFT